MKRIIIAGVLAGGILAVPAAVAHDNEQVDYEKMLFHEHCVQCCNAIAVNGGLQVSDEHCNTACDDFTRSLVQLRFGL